MKALWTTVVALALVAVPVLAEEHVEKNKAYDEMSIGTKVKIANHVLEPGKYAIACDRQELTFTRLSNGEKLVALPCKGADMGRKAASTALFTSLDKDGVRVADKLLLRGSNVEHVF